MFGVSEYVCVGGGGGLQKYYCLINTQSPALQTAPPTPRPPNQQTLKTSCG